ncbi:MAG: hypothetical protein M3347_02345, partial [Armatimonadota bacterium]|nr:hypothetical protein [Armatimonadota bacterium]
ASTLRVSDLTLFVAVPAHSEHWQSRPSVTAVPTSDGESGPISLSVIKHSNKGPVLPGGIYVLWLYVAHV